MNNQEKINFLETIAKKYGVNIEEEYPISPDECEEKFEEVE